MHIFDSVRKAESRRATLVVRLVQPHDDTITVGGYFDRFNNNVCCQRRKKRVTYSPGLKAGASTLNTTAWANPRLSVAPVACRCPGTFDVDGRILVTVNRQPTRAVQRPVTQGEHVAASASRADLRRGRETVDLDNGLAAFLSYPLEDRQELGKAEVAQLPSPQCLHPGQVQVLKTQYIVLVAQPIGELEVSVAAFVGEVRVVFGKRPPGPSAALRAGLLAGFGSAE